MARKLKPWSGDRKKIVEALGTMPSSARTSYLGVNMYEVCDLRSYYHAQDPKLIGWWIVGFGAWARWPKGVKPTQKNFAFARRVAKSVPYRRGDHAKSHTKTLQKAQGSDSRRRRRVTKVRRSPCARR